MNEAVFPPFEIFVPSIHMQSSNKLPQPFSCEDILLKYDALRQK